MSYEEFLNLPVDSVTKFVQVIKHKRLNNIPFNDEELELCEHVEKYVKQIKLNEDKTRLEYMFSLKSYQKDK
jgi:hypothetical protein